MPHLPPPPPDARKSDSGARAVPLPRPQTPAARPGHPREILPTSDPDPDPKPEPRGPKLRGPAAVARSQVYGSGLGPVRFRTQTPRPRPNARPARSPAHQVGGPHLGLLVSTLPLTSGTSPALRAPRGGWNPGDLAVVAEAVEACLLSPWKPPQARSRWGLRGASQPRGRPAPQLPPDERPRRSPETLLFPGPFPTGPTPRAPGNSSPGSPLSLPTAGVTAGWPSPNPTFRKTRRSPPSTTRPEGCKTVEGRSLRQRTSGHRPATAPF